MLTDLLMICGGFRDYARAASPAGSGTAVKSISLSKFPQLDPAAEFSKFNLAIARAETERNCQSSFQRNTYEKKYFSTRL